MEKPFLTLRGKDFVTGIAPSAHSERGGLWYKAKGIAPINDPGVTESNNNWLLRSGPPGVDLDGGGTVVVDNAMAKAKDYSGSNSFLYLLGDAGHFYKVTTGLAVSDLRSVTPITNPANGMWVFQPVGGTKYLYYMMQSYIGRWDLSGTYPSGWNDTYYNTNITSTTMHPVHRYYDRQYFGNGGYVGSMLDDGATGVTINGHALDVPANSVVTAISDDGIYLAIAITDNSGFSAGLSNCRILFWDTTSTSWQREYTINDQFIHSLTRIGNVVYAQGKRGVYEVSFGGGVKKVVSRMTGLVVTGANQLFGPELAQVYNQDCLFFAHDDGGSGNYSCIGSIGKLSPEVPLAYLEPIIAPTVSRSISLIEAQFAYPYIIAAHNSKLYSFILSGDTASTSTVAQTIYFPLPGKFKITRIEIVFGEPLRSGAAISLSTSQDEFVNPVVFGTASFATDGAIRRKRILPTNAVFAEEQISLLLTFSTGVTKIKRIEVYGQPAAQTTN